MPYRERVERPMGRAERERIEKCAADWLALRDRGFTPDTQAAFSEWLLADESHAEAVERLERSWRWLQRPRFTGQAPEVLAAVEARVQRRRTRWRRLGVAGLAVAALVVAGFFLAPERWGRGQGRGAEVASVAIRPERRALPDGSVVELNDGAEITSEFTDRERRVRLVRGVAHFAVAKDPGRPFLVYAGTLQVRAVGTEFAVHVATTEIEVLVTEGRVAVQQSLSVAGSATAPAAEAPPAVAATPAVLAAGTKASASLAAPGPLRVVTLAADEVRSAQAWRHLRVEFTAMPLAEVLQRFNRENQLQLEVSDPELGRLKISGVFRLDDPRGFARLLEASAGLRTVAAADDRLSLQSP